MAKPEYTIREVSLAEVILFLLSAIILAAYHFDYRVATYIIFLDFFQCGYSRDFETLLVRK